jgi:hypothetical protein
LIVIGAFNQASDICREMSFGAIADMVNKLSVSGEQGPVFLVIHDKFYQEIFIKLIPSEMRSICKILTKHFVYFGTYDSAGRCGSDSNGWQLFERVFLTG